MQCQLYVNEKCHLFLFVFFIPQEVDVKHCIKPYCTIAETSILLCKFGVICEQYLGKITLSLPTSQKISFQNS